MADEFAKSWCVKEVVLIGSFSRGEGCVKSDGSPLSDYDFWIITSVPKVWPWAWPGKTQRAWKEELGKNYSFVEQNYLRSGKVLRTTTTEYVDAKKYGKVLRGSGETFKRIVSQVEEVPPSKDGESIFINQVPHIFKADWLCQQGKRIEAMYELVKLINAAGVYHLLSERKYHPMLSRRLEMLEDSLGKNHELSKMYEFMIKFRESPDDYTKIYDKKSEDVRRLVKKILESTHISKNLNTQPNPQSLRLLLSFPEKFGVGPLNWLDAFRTYPSLRKNRIKSSLLLLEPTPDNLETVSEKLAKPLSWRSMKNANELELGKLIYDLKVAGA